MQLEQKSFNCPLAATIVTVSKRRTPIDGAIGISVKLPDQIDYGCSMEDNCSHRYQPACRIYRLSNK